MRGERRVERGEGKGEREEGKGGRGGENEFENGEER